MSAAARELRLVARAWDGDRQALEELVGADAEGTIARRHRAAPALCRAAEAAGLAPPESWRGARLATAGRQMLLEDSLRRVGRALEAASIPWAPLKGMDLLTRRPAPYPVPEDRPTTDLDVLVPEDRLDDARRALRALGAEDFTSGPRAERYLHDEGYAWQASLPSRVLLEVHFRLWAQVPADLPGALLADASPDSASGAAADSGDSCLPGALRLRVAHAYLVAAVHAFTVPTPRGAGIWRDLTALARSVPLLDLATEVAESAERFDVQLPVYLAARQSAELWEIELSATELSATELSTTGACAEIAERLRPTLRAAERRLRDVPADELPLAHLALARHLARRRNRRGLLRAAWRRVWPHPGVVEASTPEGWWPLRRLRSLFGG